MPRHDSLLAAQGASLLYGGTVVATHPSGTENSLRSLLAGAEREGALDPVVNPSKISSDRLTARLRRN